MEATVCLRADSGERVWVREIEARFDDPLGGPGPRGTPTLAGDALFVLGAHGNLARLDAASGEVLWEADLQAVAGREPPTWGFASSPLVVGDAVVVHAGGPDGKGTLAFSAGSGELLWSAPAGDHSYSSPHGMRLFGGEQVLVLTNQGVDVLHAGTGEVLLAYDWPYRDYRALQPHPIGESDLLLPTGLGAGTRRITLSRVEGAWSAEEVWTSRYLKPDFNDLVTHEGCAYGFDGSILTCIDLATGDRRWKQGRYGKGQILLLEDADRLLVSAEDGRVVLLAADPSAHVELTSFQAIEGKTWNHPVVVADRLYLRNSQEAACYTFRATR